MNPMIAPTIIVFAMGVPVNLNTNPTVFNGLKEQGPIRATLSSPSLESEINNRITWNKKFQFQSMKPIDLIRYTNGSDYEEDGMYFAENPDLGILVGENSKDDSLSEYKEYFLWLLDEYYYEEDNKLTPSGLKLKESLAKLTQNI